MGTPGSHFPKKAAQLQKDPNLSENRRKKRILFQLPDTPFRTKATLRVDATRHELPRTRRYRAHFRLEQMASSEAARDRLTLVNIALDLQIIICTFLHPSDILALRQTCKAFQLPTRQRVVWVDALHRVCFDNTLFLPSFPIPDMTVVELEHAAMGPRRWIELCAAFEKQHPNDSAARLCPSTTRIIEYPLAAKVDNDLFIVPGGRYLVSHSDKGIFVWDLGCTSSVDCKLIASVGREGRYYSCVVQATPDGIGLIILSSHPYEGCCIYEIHPKSETPQLIQIAHLDFDPTTDPPAHLLSDKVIWYGFYEDRIVFRIWDFRVNHSISFSADVDIERLSYNVKVITTKTAIIALSEEEILVWSIPPLSPQPPNFFDHNPAHIPPVLKFTFPNAILRDTELKTISCWYSGFSRPLYFDILRNSKLHRFKIIVKPDLYDTSLHVINTSEYTHLFKDDNVYLESYHICDDTLVACWQDSTSGQYGVYTGSTSSHFANFVSHSGPAAKVLLPATGYAYSLCPASGRFVYLQGDKRNMVVVDFF